MFDINTAVSPKVIGLKPSKIRKYFDIASQMENVISLGIGEPDFTTPWSICDAGIYSIEKGHTHYTGNSGLPKLREEIAKYQKRHFELEYNPDNQIIVTIGGSEALDLCMRAVISPGDEVIIPEPSFVCYEPISELAGGVPVKIKTLAKDNFRLMPEQLKKVITPKTKLLILPYPSNPTGAVMPKPHLEELAKVLENTNIIVLSDEIYGALTYGEEKHFSIANIPSMYERTVVVNGFSKSHAMTGWRLGFACASPVIMREMIKIHQFAIMCSPTTSQYAAIVALEKGDNDVEKMRLSYDKRRRFVVDSLNSLGLSCFEPLGAFYAFPCIESSKLNCDEFCERLLIEKSVAAIPGNAFGQGGEGFIRISYASSLENLNTAMERIYDFLQTVK